MIGKIVSSIAIGFGVTAAVALGLIASQSPKGVEGGETLDFSEVSGGETLPQPQSTAMRDGYMLQVRALPASDRPLVVMIHGSGWNGLQFGQLAQGLDADILIPDLRGHGAKPGQRGDIDHIGQLEEDLADLIDAKVKPGQKVVLLGHSSGGGLVVRFAGGPYADRIDASILLAPFLKYNAPTQRERAGGWAHVLTRRIIGLSMLNLAGVTALNHLTVIEFNMPSAVRNGPYGDLATLAYSYRLNTSFAPRSDYTADIAALPPFLLMVGERDEAFIADAYEPLMTAHSDKGIYKILPGVGHLGLVDAAETSEQINGFLHGL